jgi:hypothetical protein
MTAATMAQRLTTAADTAEWAGAEYRGLPDSHPDKATARDLWETARDEYAALRRECITAYDTTTAGTR